MCFLWFIYESMVCRRVCFWYTLLFRIDGIVWTCCVVGQKMSSVGQRTSVSGKTFKKRARKNRVYRSTIVANSRCCYSCCCYYNYRLLLIDFLAGGDIWKQSHFKIEIKEYLFDLWLYLFTISESDWVFAPSP